MKRSAQQRRASNRGKASLEGRRRQAGGGGKCGGLCLKNTVAQRRCFVCLGGGVPITGHTAVLLRAEFQPLRPTRVARLVAFIRPHFLP